MTPPTRVVFVPTVQHTGTYFTVTFLSGHWQVGNFLELPALLKNRRFMRDPYTGQHGIVADTVNLVHAHFREDQQEVIRSLALSCPTVVPLRDPLLSLITEVHARKLALEPRHLDGILWGWDEMIGTLGGEAERIYDPYWFPIDVLAADPVTPFTTRMSRLVDMLRHCGLDSVAGGFDHAAHVSERWPVVNSKGDYPLKEAYFQRDVHAVRARLGDTWQRLREREAAWRPFLERHGYRDLMWWG